MGLMGWLGWFIAVVELAVIVVWWRGGALDPAKANQSLVDEAKQVSNVIDNAKQKFTKKP